MTVAADQVPGDPPPQADAPRRPNILLVTLDTTRADVLGCFGGDPKVSPNLDRIAGRSREAYDADLAKAIAAGTLTIEKMEAMTAASIGAVAIYDMVKGLDRAAAIGPVRLLSKSGGKSGDWER